MEQKIYPVHKLDANITAILQTIITADTRDCQMKFILLTNIPV